ncbi:helix-turn-helix domain-containing protein, partial [Streptococcus alactolyticus]
MKDNYYGFCGTLKNIEKQANLTQKEIAEKIGISQPAYGDWERGTK